MKAGKIDTFQVLQNDKKIIKSLVRSAAPFPPSYYSLNCTKQCFICLIQSTTKFSLEKMAYFSTFFNNFEVIINPLHTGSTAAEFRFCDLYVLFNNKNGEICRRK